MTFGVPTHVEVRDGDEFVVHDSRSAVDHRLPERLRVVFELSERHESRDGIVAALARDPFVGPLGAAEAYEAAITDLAGRGLLAPRMRSSHSITALAARGAQRVYPWYDSSWLGRWMGTRDLARREAEGLALEFADLAAPLRTDTQFQTRDLGAIVDSAQLTQMRSLIEGLDRTALEWHEGEHFGRTLVHNHPYFNDMHESLLELASDAAGEELAPSYNFLSLYTDLGVCAPHMDAPSAKYTLDLCIEQSDPWPIHISQVVPWPEDHEYEGDDWAEQIKHDPDLDFRSYTLSPGEAIFFSGSSQWHYRDPHPQNERGFCHLIFFHFIPTGTRDFVRLFDPYLT